MPVLVSQGYHDHLYDIEKNKADTQAFLAVKFCCSRPPETWNIPEGYKLVKRMHGSELRIIRDNGILTSTRNASGLPADTQGLNDCVTVFQYDCGFNSTSGATARNQNGERISTLSEKSCWWEESLVGQHISVAFFNDTLKDVVTYQTGERQTEANKAFWTARVIEALNENKFVYVVTTIADFSCSHTRIREPEEFLLHWVDYCWGTDTERHPLRSVMISHERLNTDSDRRVTRCV